MKPLPEATTVATSFRCVAVFEVEYGVVADNCRRLPAGLGEGGIGPKVGAAANWAKLMESMIMAVEFCAVEGNMLKLNEVGCVCGIRVVV